MAVVANLNTLIQAQTGNFDNPVRQSARVLGGFRKEVGLAQTSMMNMRNAARMFGAAMSGITVASTARWGVRLAAEAENAQIGFSTLMKSEEQAQMMLADLRKMALDTPFEIRGLNKAAIQLMNVGVASRDVLPMLHRLGDAAAASVEGLDESLPRLVRAVSQMKAAARVSAEDMNQITELAIPGWQVLAKQMNMTVAEVRELSKAGQLGMREVDMLITGLGDRFQGRMSGRMQGIEAQTNKVREDFDLIGKQLGEAIVPGLKAALPHMTSLANEASRLMITMAGATPTSIAGAQAQLQDWVKNPIRSGEGSVKAIEQRLAQARKSHHDMMTKLNEHENTIANRGWLGGFLMNRTDDRERWQLSQAAINQREMVAHLEQELKDARIFDPEPFRGLQAVGRHAKGVMGPHIEAMKTMRDLAGGLFGGAADRLGGMGQGLRGGLGDVLQNLRDGIGAGTDPFNFNPPAALQRGSAEAFSAANRNRQESAEAKKLEELNKLGKEQSKLLQRIERHLSGWNLAPAHF